MIVSRIIILHNKVLYFTLVRSLTKVHMKKILLLPVIALLCACSKQTAPGHAFDRSKLDSLFEALDKSGQFMGSIALSHNGTIVYTNATGFDDTETQKRSTVDTKYRIGSISKMFTAALVFKAVEEDKLALDQTIESYFPDIENAGKITFGHLLSHRSGIHSFTSDSVFATYHTIYKSTGEMLDIISAYESDFEPGSRAGYSNSNYALLTMVLEKVYGSSLKDLLAEKICAPLALNNTYYGGVIGTTGNECHSYAYRGGWTKLPETDMSIPMGAGAIVSTPTDLVRFTEALFAGKIVARSSLDQMTTIIDGFGMGILPFPHRNRKGFGHDGSIDGFKSSVVYFPEEKLCIALTSNGSNDNKNSVLIEALNYYFNDAAIELTEAELEKYTGAYACPDLPGKIVVSAGQGALFAQITGLPDEQPVEKLTYLGEHRFSVDEIGVEYIFTPSEAQFILKQGDYESTFSRE